MVKSRKLLIKVALLGMIATFYIVDCIRVTNQQSPLFAVPIVSYKDGGTSYRVGILYSVIEWNRLSSQTKGDEEISGTIHGYEFVHFPESLVRLFSGLNGPKIDLKFVPFRD